MSYTRNGLLEFVPVIICGALWVAVVFGIGVALGRAEVRQKAVKAGVAEWVVDESGNVTFRFKPASGP